ncbi:MULTISPECIES: hypothetical protein [Haloarcula]|uniref:hypothetical protein n=1 Tax=Haloarcula TaxID=2237 RepID=UPI0023EBAC90|nr:hypothetical protein [Halomicroarcula sp. XH51]
MVDEHRDVRPVTGDVLDRGVTHDGIDGSVVDEVTDEVVQELVERPGLDRRGVLQDHLLRFLFEQCPALEFVVEILVHELVAQQLDEVGPDVPLEVVHRHLRDEVSVLPCVVVVDDGDERVGLSHPPVLDQFVRVEKREVEKARRDELVRRRVGELLVRVLDVVVANVGEDVGHCRVLPQDHLRFGLLVLGVDPFDVERFCQLFVGLFVALASLGDAGCRFGGTLQQIAGLFGYPSSSCRWFVVHDSLFRLPQTRPERSLSPRSSTARQRECHTHRRPEQTRFVRTPVRPDIHPLDSPNGVVMSGPHPRMLG